MGRLVDIKKLKIIRDVECGESFRHEERHYVLTDEYDEGDVGGICLESGEVEFFDIYTIIEPIKIKFKVEEDEKDVG